MPLESEIFGTPWHWLAHGLGLGQNPHGYDETRAIRLRSISSRVKQRFETDAHRFIDELVRAIISHCEAPLAVAPSSLIEQLAGFQDPHDHARACALLIDSLVKAELPLANDTTLQEHWMRALQRITTLPAISDAERYRNMHLLVSLFLAAGQASWNNALASPTTKHAYKTAWALADSIEQPFYRIRGAAILTTVLGMIGEEHMLRGDGQDRVADLVDLNAIEFQQPRSYPSDGVHSGRDFQLFPLLLTLTSFGAVNRHDCLRRHSDWLSRAADEVHTLTPASRASQSLFWVSALRSLGVFSAYVRDPPSFLLGIIDGYLQDTNGRRGDDYLRCTYLIHLARQLGCTDLVPQQIRQILADSVINVIGSDLYRNNSYASGFMIVAYALSVMNAGQGNWTDNIDLEEAVFCIEDDPRMVAAQLPRLGFSLVDAALRLRKPKSQDTPLSKAATLGNSRGDLQ